MAKRIKQSEIDWILRLYERHKSYAEVARITGYSLGTVRNHILAITKENKKVYESHKFSDDISPVLPELKVDNSYKIKHKVERINPRTSKPAEPPMILKVIGEFPHLYKCIKVGTDYITCINKNDMHMYEIEDITCQRAN